MAMPVPSSVDSVGKLFSEKLHSFLLENPDFYDVTFSVGPQREKVKSVKLILMASSLQFRELLQLPNLEKKKSICTLVKTEEGQEDEVEDGQDEECISLPNVDPGAFKFFLTLLPSEHVTVEALKRLNLTSDQIFNLIDISKTFGMKTMESTFQMLNKTFLDNTVEFINSPEFYNLSQKNFKAMLSSDSIQLNEVEIFQSAFRWAEYHCNQQGLESTPETIREVLGESLFEIRFPLMTNKDFCRIVCPTNILTDSEKLKIFECIATDENDRASLFTNEDSDSKSFLKFRVKNRSKKAPKLPANISIVRLFKESDLNRDPPPEGPSWFSTSVHCVRVSHRINLMGLGFLGPADSDTFYKVKVEPFLWSNFQWTSCGLIEKRIEAKQHEVFYFQFDQPVTIEAVQNKLWFGCRIKYSIAGNQEQSLPSCMKTSGYNEHQTEEDGVTFECRWWNKRLVELLFNKI